MWALCLITLSPRESFADLPTEFAEELNYFKDEIENNDPFGGNVQLNPIPETIKKMIIKDSKVLNRLKTENNLLDVDKRIWTFPKFKPAKDLHLDNNGLNM